MRPIEKIVTFYPRTGSMMRALYREGFRIRGFDELQARWNRKRCKKTPVTRPTYGFVYVFAALDLVKVGMSDGGVLKRWGSIKAHNPWLEESPLYVSPPLGKAAKSIEGAAHKALAAYHESGEWFRCERGLLVATVKKIVEEYVHG